MTMMMNFSFPCVHFFQSKTHSIRHWTLWVGGTGSYSSFRMKGYPALSSSSNQGTGYVPGGRNNVSMPHSAINFPKSAYGIARDIGISRRERSSNAVTNMIWKLGCRESRISWSHQRSLCLAVCLLPHSFGGSPPCSRYCALKWKSEIPHPQRTKAAIGQIDIPINKSKTSQPSPSKRKQSQPSIPIGRHFHHFYNMQRTFIRASKVFPREIFRINNGPIIRLRNHPNPRSPPGAFDLLTNAELE